MSIRILKELLDRYRKVSQTQDEIIRSNQLTANVSSDNLDEMLQVLADHYQTVTNSSMETNDNKQKHKETLT